MVSLLRRSPKPGARVPDAMLDSLRCGELGRANHCALYQVSLYELLARPDVYHGKRVRVLGFVHFEFEGDALYPHREDYERGLPTNGVRITRPPGIADSLSDRYAIVEGTFDARSPGLYSGTLNDVTRLQLWEHPPGPPKFRPSLRR